MGRPAADKTIPQCASWQFSTMDDPTSTTAPVAPYYLQVIPEGYPVQVQEITSTIGGSGNWVSLEESRG